jgi:UBX domain-containing protein 7
VRLSGFLFDTRTDGLAARAGVFNQHQPTSIWDNGMTDQNALAESTGGASETSERQNRLARLFQPPWDLMYKGEWDSARDEGKENKKWLLVDIQDPSIFDCQALNRDLWKNESIVETVQENFVFIQYNKDDPRASQYIQYYFPGYQSPAEYPHVAIVDPRTGEQSKLWSRKVPPAPDFLMQLHEFLDRYSLDNSARNPVAKRRSEAKKEKPVDQLTEEEMLERALQASLSSQNHEQQQAAAEDPDDLTRSVGDLRGAPSAKIDDAMDVDTMNGTEEPAEQSEFARIPSDRPHNEPAAGAGVTRVQIRHPGGRVVRRFAEDDPVQRIYEYLKAEPLEGKEGASFELVSMGQNLMASRSETIAGAGLKNGTVMVEFGE